MSISLEKINLDLVLNNATANSLVSTNADKKIVSVSNTNASTSTFLRGDLTWTTPAGAGGSGPTQIYIPGATILTNYNSYMISSTLTLSSANFMAQQSRIYAMKYANFDGSGSNMYDISMLLSWSNFTGTTTSWFNFVIDLSGVLGSDNINSSDLNLRCFSTAGQINECRGFYIVPTTSKRIQVFMYSWVGLAGTELDISCNLKLKT